MPPQRNITQFCRRDGREESGQAVKHYSKGRLEDWGAIQENQEWEDAALNIIILSIYGFTQVSKDIR